MSKKGDVLDKFSKFLFATDFGHYNFQYFVQDL